MDFTDKYFQDSQELREKYFITEEPGVKSQEADFIVAFRRELFAMFDKYINDIDIFGDKDEKTKKTAIQNLEKDALKIALFLQNFMLKSDKDNVMRKLVFINNLHWEFQTIFDKAVDNFSPIFYDDFQKDLKPIEQFFKFVCAETITKDGKLDKLQDELAEDNLSMLKMLIQEKYLDYLTQNDLTEDDVYFVYGYALKEYERQSSKVPASCSGCEKDDCTYCEHQYDTLASDRLAKEYRLIKDALGYKMLDPSYKDSEVSEMAISDQNLKTLVPQIFSGYLSKRKKHITFKSEKPTKIRLQKDKLLDKIDSVIGDDIKGIKHLTSDQFAAYMVKRFYDFQNEEGIQIDKDFRDWYNSYLTKLDKKGHKINLQVEGNIDYNKLIDEFYQNYDLTDEKRR